MFRRIDLLNEQLQREFGESIQMGIGIHGGEAIVGTMGPPKTPLLTAVGDNINIAARLESQTKEIGCDMIVSVSTLEAENLDFSMGEIRDTQVRGRDNHVRIGTFNRTRLPGGNA
jgi:adenylate cyclase